MNKQRLGQRAKSQTSRFYRLVDPVKLYLDDLRQIVEYLQIPSAEQETLFTTLGHEFVTIEELLSLRQKKVSDLEIRCNTVRWPCYTFVISVDRRGALLCRAGDTPACRKAFSEIEELLLGRRRGWRWRDRLPICAGVTGSLSAIAAMLGALRGTPWLYHTGIVLAGISLLSLVSYWALIKFASSLVILVEKQAHKGHEDVAMAVTTIVLATLIIALVARLLAGVVM